jgi:hypothetical protein
MDGVPEAMDAGLAAMLTVGAGFEAALTVRVAVAVVFPPDPVAVAV